MLSILGVKTERKDFLEGLVNTVDAKSDVSIKVRHQYALCWLFEWKAST